LINIKLEFNLRLEQRNVKHESNVWAVDNGNGEGGGVNVDVKVVKRREKEYVYIKIDRYIKIESQSVSEGRVDTRPECPMALLLGL